MNKFLKILPYTVVTVLVLSGGFYMYFATSYPNVDPPTTETAIPTDARLARGEYLANNITVCMDCHSTRDWSKYSGPLVPGTLGKGGEHFTEEMGGVPGDIYAKNITPAALEDWTDGEIMRTITNGVNKDGEAIFPLMPYLSYNKLTREDLFSLVAYLRELEPIENEVPESSLNFPMNLIVKTIPPKSYEPSPEISKSDSVKYGEYLTTIAGCADCHTPQDKGEPIPGKYLAGGFQFLMPGGVVKSANITPDKETGIGSWTKEMFIERFKFYAPDSGNIVSVNQTDFNTPMPWTMYAGMTKNDLSAIYDYLSTQKPVRNPIVRFEPIN